MTTTDLKRMLLDRRGEVHSQVHGRIHNARVTGPSDVLDTGEDSEADVQEEIEFALIQMKAETLIRIDEALVRLDRGEYGHCSECGNGISEKRLRALPFAVRCQPCEQGRERGEQRARQVDNRREPSLYFGMPVAEQRGETGPSGERASSSFRQHGTIPR